MQVFIAIMSVEDAGRTWFINVNIMQEHQYHECKSCQNTQSFNVINIMQNVPRYQLTMIFSRLFFHIVRASIVINLFLYRCKYAYYTDISYMCFIRFANSQCQCSMLVAPVEATSSLVYIWVEVRVSSSPPIASMTINDQTSPKAPILNIRRCIFVTIDVFLIEDYP